MLCDCEIMLSVFDKVNKVFTYTTNRDYKHFVNSYISNKDFVSEHVTNDDVFLIYNK